MHDYDVVVLGSGMAGLTAGLFSARYGHSSLVLAGGLLGGQLISIGSIEAMPGFIDEISGVEFFQALQEMAEDAGAEVKLGAAEKIEPVPAGGWQVQSDEGLMSAAAVIVATGCRFRTLGVPGEAEFTGKGISNCATCDGPFMRGKAVGIVGGGDSAMQEALELAKFADEVTIFHRGAQLGGQHSYRQRVAGEPKITVRCNTTVEAVMGERTVTGVRLRESGAERDAGLAGLFVYVGLDPNTELVRDLVSLDDTTRVITDISMRTEQTGIFAAGSVRSGNSGQAATAAGEGATAAAAVHRLLTDGADIERTG